MLEFSDIRIISSIKKGGLELEQSMRYLYLTHPCRQQVFSFVQKRRGSREDAEDIFQDGVRFLILQIRNDKYKFEGELGAYLFGICKNLWFKRFRRIAREEGLPDTYQEKLADETPELSLMDKERKEQIEELLSGLGEACKKVLELWQLSYSMKEIAAAMGYKTDGVARKKKRLCMKKLLETLKKQPAWEAWITAGN